MNAREFAAIEARELVLRLVSDRAIPLPVLQGATKRLGVPRAVSSRATTGLIREGLIQLSPDRKLSREKSSL